MIAVLGLDTADRTAGVAVVVGGEVRVRLIESSPFRHSVRLFAMIDYVLGAAGLRREELDCVAVSQGPGSFTGLRVGIATAKGIAFGLGLPVVGVSTLEAMAHGLMPFPGIAAGILDARKNQVYAAAFDALTGRQLVAEAAWNPDQLAIRLGALEQPVIACGSGVGAYPDLFRERLADRWLATPESRWTPPPDEIARMGWKRMKAGQASDAGSVLPTYRRRSEAEEARERPTRTE